MTYYDTAYRGTPVSKDPQTKQPVRVCVARPFCNSTRLPSRMLCIKTTHWLQPSANDSSVLVGNCTPVPPWDYRIAARLPAFRGKLCGKPVILKAQCKRAPVQQRVTTAHPCITADSLDSPRMLEVCTGLSVSGGPPKTIAFKSASGPLSRALSTKCISTCRSTKRAPLP